MGKLQLEINRIFHNLILSTLQIDEAIAFCQELIVHPNTRTREQAQRILYIIKSTKNRTTKRMDE